MTNLALIFDTERLQLLAIGGVLGICFLILVMLLVSPMVTWRRARKLEERRAVWRTLEQARRDWKGGR